MFIPQSVNCLRHYTRQQFFADLTAGVVTLDAGVSLDAYPRHLATIVTQVPKEARGWFETVLCVRAQQAGRKEAWSRFAEDAFRELSPCMLEEMAATRADSPPSI